MPVRPFCLADTPATVALLSEMQAHYGVPCPAAEEIAAALADLPPGNGILLAEIGASLAGFAGWSLQWPGPGLKRGLFLKELYVASTCRGMGVGRALMAGLARLALHHGATRLDFTADATNARLLAFYVRLGAAPDGRRFHRIGGGALSALAAS